MDQKDEIRNLEERFIAAMKASDVAALDAMIDDNLTFTGHDGQRYTKADDINAHRDGQIEIFEIAISEQRVSVFDDVAVVSVRKEISGAFYGETVVGIFRFMRIWKKTNTQWKVIAAHSTQILH